MKIKDFLNAECVNLATSKFQKCSKTLFTLLASGRRKGMINGTEPLSLLVNELLSSASAVPYHCVLLFASQGMAQHSMACTRWFA